MKQYLSALDLATLLKVTTRTLRNWAEDGSGPKREVRDLEPCYPVLDLVRWLKERYPHIKLGSVPRELTPEARASLLEAWETRLCRRYGLRSTADLYQAIRQADFHETCADPIEFWRPACFAAFSGRLPEHRLTPERLRDLLNAFRSYSDPELAAKKKLTAAQFTEEIKQAHSEDGFESFEDDGPWLRDPSAHLAQAHRYQCASSGRYDFPNADPYIAGKMTPAEREIAFGESGYVSFVMEKGNPACKWVRLCCERNLEDLMRARDGSAAEVL